MNASPLLCPSCHQPVQPGQPNCRSCGAALGNLGPPGPTGSVWGPGPDRFVVNEHWQADSKAEERTRTGLLLMIIAFALLWIPYVSDLGELIALIGVVFLWLGRLAFDQAHWRSVVVGSACVVLGLVVGLVVGFSFAADLISVATTPGESISAFIASLQSSLTALFAVGIAIAVLTSVGYVALPYALADRTSRLLLWGGLVISIAISVLVFVFLAPLISAALAQATSGGTINLAPVQALETKEIVYDLALGLPNLMFLWAYYRTRQRVFPPLPVPPELPPLPSKYGRFD
jgi:hypothetical protein